MKKKLISVFVIVFGIYGIYKTTDFLYYYTFNGNDDIFFIDFEGDESKKYETIFQLDEFKGKYVFATINNRYVWDVYIEDLKSMDTLYTRFKGTNLVFLYTVDSVDRYRHRYDWKKMIRKYDLKGYHIDLPSDYEWNLNEIETDGFITHTRTPKYMLISADGKIINKWATQPSKTNELIQEIEKLMNL